jgi:hypothetical protein
MDITRPLKCRVRVEESGDELVLRRLTGSPVVGVFLLLWLAGWTAGCVLLVGMVAQEPTPEHLLFAAPFWAAWVLVLCLLTRMLLGFERLRVGPDGLEHRTLLGRRLVPLAEVMGVAHDSKVVDAQGNGTEPGVKVETLGRPVRFGQGLDEAERLWLADRLLGRFHALCPTRTFEHRPGKAVKPAEQVEVLRPGRVTPGPPSDCAIRSHSDWGRTTFVRWGTLSLANLGITTFLVLFWDGGVGVFVMQLLKEFQWFPFLFLLPFEAVGVALIVAWLGVLLAPFRAERWSVSPAGVAARSSVLGVGRSSQFEPADLGRVELRKYARGRKGAAPDEEGDTPYSLGLVGRDGRDLLVVDGLTEGEARWVGGVLVDTLKGSLPKDGGPAPPPRDTSASLWDREIDG